MIRVLTGTNCCNAFIEAANYIQFKMFRCQKPKFLVVMFMFNHLHYINELLYIKDSKYNVLKKEEFTRVL